MISTRFTALSVAVLLISSSCLAAPDSIEIELVASGLTRPLGLTHAGDGSGRLFISEQGGAVRIVGNGALLAEPFINLSELVSCCGERGLLGLAFHPDYKNNRQFFVNYTNASGDTVISRFTTSATNPNRADAGSELELLRFDQPYANHNGGHVAFGPDGYLYIASGDGGSGGDPKNNAQSLRTLLGKILRLDVNNGSVSVPPDNPFVDTPGARPEIWAYGLRNPWRFSFDRTSGDLFIGDVGQNEREEIDFQPAGSSGGENYGWRLKEASDCYTPSSDCDREGLVDPILEYGHDQGCSVTGGYRYRANPSSPLNGIYLFGDFCTGIIWGASQGEDGSWSRRVLLDTDLSLASFGEDETGNVYVVSLSGEVYRLVAPDTPTG